MADDPTTTGGPIKLSQSSDFQKALAAAASKPDAVVRDEIRAVAKPFIDSDQFVSGTSGTSFQAKVASFSAKIDQVEGTKDLTVADVKIIAAAVFGQQVGDLVKSDDFTKLVQNLRDSLLAIKYVQVMPCPLT